MMKKTSKMGRVFICGAGPGDPKLMTVRAAELLKTCDVILYDRLVGKEIIDQLPEGAEKVYVGRAVGDPTTHQDKTNELMARYASRGKRVLRLKGGDPFIFGRGAEEAEYLAGRGIPFEIVPGITSAIASPAYAGIPLTHRRFSSSVAIVTGHEGAEKEPSPEPAVRWDRLAGAVDTIVVLMGIGQLRQISDDLIRAGRKGSTGVAIVESGTTGRQRVVRGTLGTIASVAARSQVRPPAVIVIGDVSALHERIGGWFSPPSELGDSNGGSTRSGGGSNDGSGKARGKEKNDDRKKEERPAE